MFSIRMQCPHCCQPHSVNFFGLSEYTCGCTPSELKKEQINAASFCAENNRKFALFHGAALCSSCHCPVLLKIKVDREYLMALRECLQNPCQRYDGPEPEILDIEPKPTLPYAHPALPANIRKDFIALQRIINETKDAPWIVISACRTVLESAVNELEGAGSTLHARLDDLKDKGILSAVLYDWATAIKGFGNAATHESRGTPGAAQEMIEFIKIFLQYTFELPDRVQSIRASFQNR